MKQLAILTDLDRCTGCQACSIACKMENGVSLGAFWTRVHEVGPTGRFPELQMYFLPVACQHCERPACVKACPTGASYKRNDGIVLIDSNKCIGCQACQRACPYGVRIFDSATKKVGKCTLCAHLVDEGGLPACVKTCTARARYFGDLNNPTSEVAKKVREADAHVYTLLAAEGTRPSARYILRRQKWWGRG